MVVSWLVQVLVSWSVLELIPRTESKNTPNTATGAAMIGLVSYPFCVLQPTIDIKTTFATIFQLALPSKITFWAIQFPGMI